MPLQRAGKTARCLRAAEGYLELGMPDHALAELDRIPPTLARDARAARLRGEAFSRKGLPREALAAYQWALRTDPDNLELLLDVSACLRKLARLNEAIAVMRRAYRSNPREPRVLYRLACYFSVLGNKPQALSWLGRAIRMQSSLRDQLRDEDDFRRYHQDPDFRFVAGWSEGRDNAG